MPEDRWDKVGALLEEVLTRPPGERNAFLEEACDDPAVRAEVASLLSMSDEASNYFGRLASVVQRPQEASELDAGASADPLELEGARVGRYVALEHLDGGGMGVIYKARDTELGRPVALKFLPSHLSRHQEAEERFVREARAAASLDHANVATVYEIGEAAVGEQETRRRFIAMAYYDGETLKEKLAREEPLPVEKALDYATQIVEALARAHAAGIVHRDVKPANVMVTEHDEVKLLDFGLAQAADRSRLTMSGRRLGTAAYMSPEQARGETVDSRTDLWALGAVLYEMLTGERPFQGERETAVLHAILHEEPEPVVEQRSEVSSVLAEVVEGCLKKDPAERYGSAEELLEDLRAVHSDADVAPGQSQGARLGSERSYGRWLGGRAAVLITLAVGLGWALWPGGSAEEGPSPAESPRSIAVLPFEVSGSGAEEWRDGMVTVLSTGLDGAAGLRAIPDRTIFAAWKQVDTGRAAPHGNQALETARHVGAEYAVAGSAVALGSELRLVANVHDTDSGRRLGKAQVQGAPEEVMALADDMTREVLGVLLAESEEAIPSVDLASITTESLSALRAFLEGERHFRAGDYEAALEAFEAATEADSTFALAFARLNPTRYWSGRFEGAIRASRRAYELSDRLPRRERRIVRARYLWYNEGRSLAAADALRQLTEEYPDDPTVWFYLGEVLFHHAVPGGLPEAEEAFQRAVELDPGVAQYRHHLVELAFSLHRDSVLAARRIAAHPEGPYKQTYQLARELVFGAADQHHEALARVDRLAPTHGEILDFALRHPTDGASQVAVMRRLKQRENIRSAYRRYFAVWLIASTLERGQIEKGLAQLEEEGLDASASSCLLAGAVSLGAPLPDAALRPHLDPSQLESDAPADQLMCAGIYLLEQGRSEEVPVLLRRLRRGGVEQGLSKHDLQGMVDELKGYRAWKAGKLRQAVRLWERSSRPNRWEAAATWSEFHYRGAVWRGDLYRELGELRKAEDWYLAAWEHPVAHERLGRLYEVMDRPEKAAAAYERFITAWKDADPALQERVQKAQGRLQALSHLTADG